MEDDVEGGLGALPVSSSVDVEEETGAAEWSSYTVFHRNTLSCVLKKSLFSQVCVFSF